jgi:hypothetical protein
MRQLALKLSTACKKELEELGDDAAPANGPKKQ